MKRQLPPLNALVAFETAARLGSFKAAGDDLHVTPSAVSHHVRSLEDWLGTKLFERGVRTIRLTGAGERYVGEVTRLLDDLERVTREEREQARRRATVTLQTTDSFANRWLVARLPAFHRQFPDITIRIVTHGYREPFRASEADIGILFGRGPWRNGVESALLEEDIFPVCVPALADRLRQGGDPDAAPVLLIEDDNLGVDWEEWFTAAGAEVDGSQRALLVRGPRFNHSHLALKAVEMGEGIALASRPLVGDALAEGVLVAPFDTVIRTGQGYHLVEPIDGAARDRCRPVTDWLREQAGSPVQT